LLIRKNKVGKFQNKWLKDLTQGVIKISKDPYTLQLTDNKRKLIYDKYNKLIGTEAYIINDQKEILNK
jgi:hypothetical protein